MRELSVFIDESGGQNGHSEYYVLTLVMHDQGQSVDEAIAPYTAALASKGLPNIPFHASPLINGHGPYENIEPGTRKRLLTAFFVLFRHLPIRYKALLYRRSEFPIADSLSAAMRRGIIEFIFDNLDYFQKFDQVKIYYDGGQQIVSKAIRDAFGYALAKDATLYRYASPADYVLAQVADFLCTMELTARKYRTGKQTATDAKFFGTARDFKQNYMKAIERKKMG